MKTYIFKSSYTDYQNTFIFPIFFYCSFVIICFYVMGKKHHLVICHIFYRFNIHSYHLVNYKFPSYLNRRQWIGSQGYFYFLPNMIYLHYSASMIHSRFDLLVWFEICELAPNGE